MVAAGEKPRKRRYTPDPGSAPATVGPLSTLLLKHIAEFGFLTVRQLASLTGRSEQGVRRSLRPAFDSELVRLLILPRALLVEDDDTLRAVFGSAPNLYRITPAGLRLVRSLGVALQPLTPPDFKPSSGLLVRHELMVRDVVIHFFCCARAHAGHRLEAWRIGEQAVMSLNSPETPTHARPDAWIRYRFGDRVLAAAIEADRATEGDKAWLRKIAVVYRRLLSTDAYKRATGAEYGRVVVVTTTVARRDALAALIAAHAEPPLALRFYLAALPDLTLPDLTEPVWLCPGAVELCPLIPRTFRETESRPC